MSDRSEEDAAAAEARCHTCGARTDEEFCPACGNYIWPRQESGNLVGSSAAATWYSVAVWIFGAVGSGVLGNAAYAGLQQLMGNRRRGDSREQADAILLATLAVILECKRSNERPPEQDRIKVERVSQQVRGVWIVEMTDGERKFLATVPPGDLEDLRVTLSRPLAS
ncbi:NOB1 family endonuclease [Micromonospora okii]|uniref:NOB1 family endonuclease n=1 Tax=Micromonospora okii TaxID=1182970 RepID=UPI001E4E131D|nr:NOB1 family endonuclease [Micromonospora okii]